MYRNNLLAIVIFLVAIGLVMVFSSSILYAGSFRADAAFFKQLLWVSFSFFGMWIASKTDYHRVIRAAPWLLGLTLLLLVAVLLLVVAVYLHSWD